MINVVFTSLFLKIGSVAAVLPNDWLISGTPILKGYISAMILVGQFKVHADGRSPVQSGPFYWRSPIRVLTENDVS